MIFHIGRRINSCGQLSDVYGPAHFFESAVMSKLLSDGHHVDWPLIEAKCGYGLKYFLINRVVKTVGHKDVAHVHVCVFLKHTRSQHHLFEVGVARREFS